MVFSKKTERHEKRPSFSAVANAKYTIILTRWSPSLEARIYIEKQNRKKGWRQG